MQVFYYGKFEIIGKFKCKYTMGKLVGLRRIY